jgi:hypothetical protein
VTTMADLQPYGWYDRIETFLDLRRVQSRLKVAGHDSSTPIRLERLLGERIPGLSPIESRIFYVDKEQHARWQEAQAALTELARKKNEAGGLDELRALLRVGDSARALEIDSVAMSEEGGTVVVADYADIGGVTAVEALLEKADYLREHPNLADFRVGIVVPLLCVKGYDSGTGGKHGLLKYAQEREVLIAERSMTGTDTLVH